MSETLVEPGPAAPLAYAAPVEIRLLPLQLRSRLAIGFILGTLALSLVSILLMHWQIQMLEAVNSGQPISMNDAVENDQRIVLCAIGTIALVIGGAITFIMWLYRAAWNVKFMGGHLQHSPGWAIGGWFVPFLNLVRPYQVVRNVAEESDASAGGRLGVWWTCWILAALSGRLSGTLVNSEDATLQQMIASSWISIASDVFTLGAGVMIILVIRQVTIRLTERANVLQ